MNKSSADVFVYAKASGMLAKSFVGTRMSKLFTETSLEGLWKLLFQSEPPPRPDSTLAQAIEREAENRFLQGFISLVQKYSKPHVFLVDLLRFYDYNNLKTVIASLDILGEGEAASPPPLANIGKYSMLNYDRWPSLKHMTASTPVSWCTSISDATERQKIEARLDAQYIRTLLYSASRLDSVSRGPVKNLLKEELVLDNIVWGLRLRLYYGLSPEAILEQLTTAEKRKSILTIQRDEMVKPVAQVLSLPLDSYRDWEGWKYFHLLNPQEEGMAWTVDPRWIQRMARVELYKRALKEFHRHPFTAHVLFCWFKVKQYELDCIRMAAEGIRLKISPAQVGKFAGITVV